MAQATFRTLLRLKTISVLKLKFNYESCTLPGKPIYRKVGIQSSFTSLPRNLYQFLCKALKIGDLPILFHLVLFGVGIITIL